MSSQGLVFTKSGHVVGNFVLLLRRDNLVLFQGRTTMWQGPQPAINLVIFVVMLVLAGMLEALQISFLATSKMRKEQLQLPFFGKKDCRLTRL